MKAVNAAKPGRYLTPPEVAARLHVSPTKVMGWIRKAELRAVNVGNGIRPRYRIAPESLAAFLKVREVQPPVPRMKCQRRQMPNGGPLDPELGKKLVKRGEATLVGSIYYPVRDGVTLIYPET